MAPVIAIAALAGAVAVALYVTRPSAASRSTVADSARSGQVEPDETAEVAGRVFSGRRLPGAPASGATGVVERILKGEFLPKPTTEQMNAFVTENHRSLDSLLGAFGATGERAYLKEAVAAHPTNSKALYQAYFFASEYKSDEVATPERRQYLEALKSADPKNSLAWYLSARDYFKAGQPQAAIGELRTASTLPGYDYYALEYMQDTQDAFAAAGHPDIEAKAESTFGLPLPHLAQLRDLSRALVEQATAAQQAGDQSGANEILTLGLSLAQRFQPGQKLLIEDLVGVAVERTVLAAFDPAAPYGGSGQTVKDRLEQVNQRRDALKAIGNNSDALMPLMTEQDLSAFIDRLKTVGEESALRWAKAKYGM